MIPRIIRLEMARQLHFYRLANELRRAHGLPPLPSHRNDDDQRVEEQVAQSAAELLPDVLSDVTALFAETSSGMIRQSIDDGGVMMALP